MKESLKVRVLLVRYGKTIFLRFTYCTVLYCTVLYCTVLYCTVLYCTVLYCTVLYCTVLYCMSYATFTSNTQITLIGDLANTHYSHYSSHQMHCMAWHVHTGMFFPVILLFILNLRRNKSLHNFATSCIYF